MSEQPTSRQALYDRIRQSSRDAVILEEMVRLGFWPEQGVMPEDPADEIRRRGELEGQLRALRTESSRLHNLDALKKEARKRRMAESRRKREETKQRRLSEGAERAAAWKARQAQEIGYLGAGVSAGLNQQEGDAERLRANKLPSLNTAAEIARGMGISVGQLRALAFTRSAATTTHYVHFKIPKRRGGERAISAPMPRLKQAQRWILATILAPLETQLHEAAHGFRHGRSIVSNATPHVGAAVVVNTDLKDFFPTVSYRRVKGFFRAVGYSEAAATIFGLLCTEPETVELKLDGVTYYVALEQRFLPQGAPTSPALTNLICRRLDRRLSKVATDLGFRYTRYADDLSFSSDDRRAEVGKLLRRARWVVTQEGFSVHPNKTRVQRQGRRQEVTGLVVNQAPSVGRAPLRRFRATLHQIEKDGPRGKRWGDGGDVIAAVEGFANYVAMVSPERGRPLQQRVARLVKKHGKQPQRVRAPRSPEPEPPTPDAPATGPGDGAGEKKKKKKWWKIF